MLRHYILFYICLHNLHKLGPFVPLNPPLQGLDGIGVLLDAVDLHFPSSLLAGAHQFGQDQAFARADIVAHNDLILGESLEGGDQCVLIFIIFHQICFEDIVDLPI